MEYVVVLVTTFLLREEIIIVGRPAAIDRRPLVLWLGSAILSATAVVTH